MAVRTREGAYAPRLFQTTQCSGQLIPDNKLDRLSAFAGGTPLLN